MYIRSLKLTNFRSYENLNIEFTKGINFFTGFNGEGKTNVLEAISLLSLGKSFVTSEEKECIRISKEYTKIDSIIEKNVPLNIEITISNVGTRVSINKKELHNKSKFYLL